MKEGENTFGTKPGSDIVLPRHSTVLNAGTINYDKSGGGLGKVTFQMNRGQRAVVGDESKNEGELELDQVLAHNHLRLYLIERSGRLALRIRDLRSRNFLDFEELNFYQPKKKFLVEGRFEPFRETEELEIETVIDTQIALFAPGVIHFELGGKKLQLTPTLESAEEESWFIMFKDQTSSVTTYGGGRFMYIDPPGEDGKVTLNFNRAYNPPCAYSDWSTCPLPPSQNWLDVAIEAGEKLYEGPEKK